MMHSEQGCLAECLMRFIAVGCRDKEMEDGDSGKKSDGSDEVGVFICVPRWEWGSCRREEEQGMSLGEKDD